MRVPTFRASRLIELNNNVLRILCRENGKAMNNLPAFASKKVFPQVLDKQGEQKAKKNIRGKGALELIHPQSQVDR